MKRRRAPDHHQMRTCTCDACWKVAHSYPGMTHRHCPSGKKKGTWLMGEERDPAVVAAEEAAAALEAAS